VAEKPEVIFEDADLIVVLKPVGITVIPDRIHTERATVQSILEKEYGKLFVVHRIDKGTSGIMCFARNEAAHRNLSLQFQNHTVKKIYRAIVKGRMKQKEGIVDAPLAENTVRPGTMLIHKRGKDAISHYWVEEEFKHATLVKVEIKTGRTHQIRVHMASLGNPLLVDEVYAKAPGFFFSSIKKNYKQTDEEERPTIARLTLHASSLTLVHPTLGKEMTFETKLPKDMEVVLKLLRRYDS
jgi:23S rRNA pseudouridine955/2504/2580 synthase/23S rRNA pseudouridine1911/1915/1917 synthase